MIVGIDLGTTHSLIGMYGAEGPVLFPNPHGQVLTPSVVSVADGAVLVGQAARDRLISHPDASVAHFKRWMGTQRETRLGDHRFRPEELSALVLRTLLADAEAALGHKVEEAVISVPAYFSDAQRKATRAAGELAGIRVDRLINEPTAAALAYGLQQRDQEGRILVLDLGGGTFDVSILELFEGIVEVHASAGDNFLGGEDFLQVLLHAFKQDMQLDAATLDGVEQAQLMHRLEQLKREISARSEASLEITLGGRELQWSIEESRYAQLCEPLLQRMRAPIERAIRDARLKPEALDDIILVGGAARMPMVTRLATRMFGRLPLRHINPDQAIALGAAVAAGMKARDSALQEVVLTDVCPYTLGTQVSRMGPDGKERTGYFHPIIQRNSVVPVSREDVFHPIRDEQKFLRIDVYQGESPTVDRNIKLGELQVPLTTHDGDRSVTTRFTYDVDGILQVEVTENATGKRHELVLEQNPGVLAPEQIRQRLQALDALKIHPREQQPNLALLARTERMYSEYVDQRDQLQGWLLQFREVLESQDPQRVEQHRRELSRALDELEGVR